MSKILECKELGFVMLRKSCTSSIKELVRDVYGLDNSQHIHSDTRFIYHPPDYSKLKTVCIIRDPRTRIVSAWQNKMHDNKNQPGNEHMKELGFKVGCSFRGFLKVAQSVYKEESHIKPQVMQIPAKVDYVLCFETIENDWKKLQAIYEWLPDLKVFNKSKYKREPLSYITEKEEKIINRMYKEDLELWQKLQNRKTLADPR